MLKQGDYEMWRLRIEQYFQVQDYALWDVIESENSFVPVTQTTTADEGNITTTISSLVTAEEKIKKKNDVKARSMLLMALTNEHLMTLISTETRFGSNEATKKTQKTLLKQTLCLTGSPSQPSFLLEKCWIASWAPLEVVGMDVGYYPRDLKGFAGEKA
nr:hypothetical protein [Tanacetum cinerariifolium]